MSVTLTNGTKDLVVEPHLESSQVGILVTQELEAAIADCRTQVQRISKQCRAKNSRFRDIEFDLQKDKAICLNGLFPDDEKHSPSDVLRVTQIFDEPKFFKDTGADSADVVQGLLGDCWFLSALATVSTFPGLIEKICVERDESIGVYGFIFFKDNAWKSVIIDDLLYTSIPKYEELKVAEQQLYHSNKDLFNQTARKSGKILYFAHSGSAGETWVPLIEKAFAKLHGSYASLSGGLEREGMEDLTGGVSIEIESKDIWDVDRFWTEELSLANKDRLFGCWFGDLDSSRNGVRGGIEVQGLFGAHTYSVLRALECNGKRFVVCRNPWGESEWTGRWADGSKEWTQEWLAHLPEIGHTFGNDGQFVMEYSDWLQTFSEIDRTIIFDSTWCMSSHFLFATVARAPSPWSYGDLSFTFVLSAPSRTVIALSELDRRYFKDLASKSVWDLDFALVKEGDQEPLAESGTSGFGSRAVSIDVHLEAGKYYVYTRIDREIMFDTKPQEIKEYEIRQLSKVLTQRAQSQSIASNFDLEKHKYYIPTTLHSLIGKELSTDSSNDVSTKDTDVTPAPADIVTSIAPEEIEEAESVCSEEIEEAENVGSEDDEDETPYDVVVNGEVDFASEEVVQAKSSSAEPNGTTKSVVEVTAQLPVVAPVALAPSAAAAPPAAPEDETQPKLKVPRDDLNSVCLGLRVYTHKDVPVVVKGRLPVRKA